jgi:hypothetical protein
MFHRNKSFVLIGGVYAYLKTVRFGNGVADNIVFVLWGMCEYFKCVWLKITGMIIFKKL